VPDKNWTLNNFSVTAGVANDSFADTPTSYGIGNAGGDVRGNYCTLNPIDSGGPTTTIKDGNLRLNGGTDGAVRSTFWINPSDTQGYYFEGISTALSSGGSTGIGVGSAHKFHLNSVGWTTTGWDAAAFIKRGAGGSNHWNWYSSLVAGGGLSDQDTGVTAATTDILQVAIKGGKVWLGVNNVWQTSGNPVAGTGQIITASNPLSPYAICSLDGSIVVNFGQRPFVFAPPTGFKALCAQNLPNPAIKVPKQYMDVALYTGNGGANAITGMGFQPDLDWIKRRSSAENNNLTDGVRGATITLYPNLQNAEAADTAVTAFTADGFTLNGGGNGNVSGQTFVAWLWKKGPLPGFDIVAVPSASAAAVNHGLGVKPAMIIIKSRSAVTNWPVTHRGFLTVNMGDAVAYLNLTNAYAVNTGYWGGEPTATQFYAGNNIVNTGQSYIAYLFAEVPGFSRFGNYVGNGAADGPFVWCGHRPRYLMIKRIDAGSAEHWNVFDAAREPYNVASMFLSPNTASAEGGGNRFIDLLSNGFKFRDANTSQNAAGGTYIFSSFAETPFKFARAR